MRLFSQLPVLLLSILLLASCDDSLLPAPIVPDLPPPDTIIGPNGHIIFSTVDPIDPITSDFALFHTDSDRAPQLMWDKALISSKPGIEKMVFMIGQILEPSQIIVSDHFGNNAQTINPLISDSEQVSFASAAINPQGTLLAFATEEFWTGRTRLYTLPIEGPSIGIPKLIDDEFANGTTPAWSADGTKLAYYTQEFDETVMLPIESYGFSIVDVSGSQLEARVIHQSEFEVDPSSTIDWSPIRDEVVYCAQLELHAYNWDSRSIYSGLEATSASFSPDGKYVVTAGTNNQQIHIVDWESKLTSQLTFDNNIITWNPSWSPDGRCIVFTSLDIRANPSQSQLEIVQVADPAVRKFLAAKAGKAFWVKKPLL